MTSQHQDLTSQHKDLTRRQKDLTIQHNYPTSDGRSMPLYKFNSHKINISLIDWIDWTRLTAYRQYFSHLTAATISLNLSVWKFWSLKFPGGPHWPISSKSILDTGHHITSHPTDIQHFIIIFLLNQTGLIHTKVYILCIAQDHVEYRYVENARLIVNVIL